VTQRLQIVKDYHPLQHGRVVPVLRLNQLLSDGIQFGFARAVLLRIGVTGLQHLGREGVELVSVVHIRAYECAAIAETATSGIMPLLYLLEPFLDAVKDRILALESRVHLLVGKRGLVEYGVVHAHTSVDDVDFKPFKFPDVVIETFPVYRGYVHGVAQVGLPLGRDRDAYE